MNLIFFFWVDGAAVDALFLAGFEVSTEEPRARSLKSVGALKLLLVGWVELVLPEEGPVWSSDVWVASGGCKASLELSGLELSGLLPA